MNFAFLTKYPFVYQKIINKIAYYSKGIYQFADSSLIPVESTDADIEQPFFAYIVAKQHYTQTWKSYAAVDKTEINQLIRIQKQSDQSRSLYQIVENKNIDGFEVKTITFDDEINQQISSTKILIPETELLNSQENQVIELTTPQGVLFSSQVNNKVNSAYAQGIISNIERYKLSAGMPSETQLVKVSAPEFPRFLLQGLQETSWVKLQNVIWAKPKNWLNVKQLHWLYWAPLITALLFYVITNSYLALSIYANESEIAEHSAQIQQILVKKQQIDKNTRLLNQLSVEFSQQQLTHHHWNIVGKLTEQQAEIKRITYQKGTLTVRGSVAKASEMLAAIASYPGVESASFKGAVRSSRGQDSFVLEIIAKEPV